MNSPVGRKSTRFKIIFFSLLLAGFIGIQYSWVSYMQKDKLQRFRVGLVSGMNSAVDNLPLANSLGEYTDTTIANMLKRSFISKGFGNLLFEYALAIEDEQLFSSPGFTQKKTDTTNNLVLHYVLRRTGEFQPTNESMTVVVPLWKRIALREMGWIISASVVLTLMIMVIFCSASLFGSGRHQLYEGRDSVVQHMMQQLETPLSTVSLAADALRNDKVKLDPGKVNYYQRVISEENQRMNEQVEKFLRDMNKD